MHHINTSIFILTVTVEESTLVDFIVIYIGKGLFLLVLPPFAASNTACPSLLFVAES
jgi:hypothetical protein